MSDPMARARALVEGRDRSKAWNYIQPGGGADTDALALEAERRRLSHIRLESASGAQQLSRSHAQYVVGAEQQRLADIRLDSERAHAEAGWRAQGSPYEFQPTQPQPQPQMQMQMQMQMQPQQPPPPPQQQQQKKLRN